VCMRGVIPVILLNHLDEVQVQPPRAKLPRPLVPIRALKIRARGFVPRRDVPAAAALIRHEGAPLPFLLALPFPISPTCLPAALCRIRAGASSSGSGGGGGGCRERRGRARHKPRVGVDRGQAVVHAQRGALERAEQRGHGGVLLGRGEDEVCVARRAGAAAARGRGRGR